MDIFSTVKGLEESKQHTKFKLLNQEAQMLNEKRILESWTNGMIDKDGKMVREFQETFHSCFWEFFLFKLFQEAGFTLDQSHQMPDFIINAPTDMYVEAVVSNIKEGGKPESKRTIEDPLSILRPPYLHDMFYEELNESITRDSNAVHSKIKKYRDSYLKREWVREEVPFVIALSSYDQVNYGREYIYSMLALLYGMYFDANSEMYYQKDSIIKPGTKDSSISIGIFNNPSYSDISAIIYSCTVTIGKLTSLSISNNMSSLNTVYNIRKNNVQWKYQLQIVSSNNPEHLADGVFIFHNPNAKHKLPEELFSTIPVKQFFFNDGNLDYMGNATPLVARYNTSSLLAMVSEPYIMEQIRLYNRLSINECYDVVEE